MRQGRVLRLAPLPRGSDCSKVNRGDQTVWGSAGWVRLQRLGDRGLRDGSPSLTDGAWGGNSGDTEIVYLLKPWSLSLCDLCIMSLPLLGNTVSDHWLSVFQMSRTGLGKGLRMVSNLGYSAYTAAACPTRKTIYVHLRQISIMRWPTAATSGSCSH